MIFAKGPGKTPLVARTHATNRLRDQESFFLNGDLVKRGISQRSPTHAAGAFEPAVAPASPGHDDGVWAVDLNPIAVGSSTDVFPGPLDTGYVVEPNGADVGDGKAGVRSISAEVRRFKAKGQVGGSWDRESKYHQHIQLADESQVVSSVTSEFEAPRVAAFTSFRTDDLSLPSPFTYEPRPVDGKTILMPTQDEIARLPTKTQAALGLPRSDWDTEDLYEPPRAMLLRGKGQSRSERWSFPAFTGPVSHDLARPRETMQVGAVPCLDSWEKALPKGHLVRAGWSGMGSVSAGNPPTRETWKHQGGYEGVTRRGLGGLGGLEPKCLREAEPGKMPSGDPAGRLVGFCGSGDLPGAFHGHPLLRKSEHRAVVPNGTSRTTFTSGRKDPAGPRHHHLAVAHLKPGTQMASLVATQKAKAADRIWGPKVSSLGGGGGRQHTMT